MTRTTDTAAPKTTDVELLGDEALTAVAGGTIFRVKPTDKAVVVPTPSEATDMYIRRHTQ